MSFHNFLKKFQLVVPTLLAQILTRAPVNTKALETRFFNFQNVFDKFQSETDGGRQLINLLALANALLKWVYFLLKIYFFADKRWQ